MHNEKEGMPVTALREIKILKALKHTCIINIVDMIVVRGRLAFPTFVFPAHALLNCYRQGLSRLCAHGLSVHGP